MHWRNGSLNVWRLLGLVTFNKWAFLYTYAGSLFFPLVLKPLKHEPLNNEQLIHSKMGRSQWSECLWRTTCFHFWLMLQHHSANPLLFIKYVNGECVREFKFSSFHGENIWSWTVLIFYFKLLFNRISIILSHFRIHFKREIIHIAMHKLSLPYYPIRHTTNMNCSIISKPKMFMFI